MLGEPNVEGWGVVTKVTGKCGMKMKNKVLCIAMVLACGSLGLVGCGADPTITDAGAPVDQVSNKITGNVEEWKVNVSAVKAEAGEVIFAIANYGSIKHEFLVTKTSYEPGKIPVGSNNRFDEEDPGISVIDEIPEWEVNDAKVLRINLEPGMYELLCNIEGHYGNGMHTSFEVVKGDTVGDPMATDTTTPGGSTDGDAVSNDITGSVQEWAVGVSAHEAKAGDVTFTIENVGTIPHEFLVVKTDFAPGEIPLGTNNRFDEEGKGISVINEIPEWDPKTTGNLTVTLEPGTYELLCNIEGHYKNGMHASLTVS